MGTRILSYDPVTKSRTLFHHNIHDDEALITSDQQVDEIVEFNKAAYAATDERAHWRGDMHLVARIPLTLLFKLQNEGILDDDERMKTWLNDPENRHFRVRPGRV